ncbi:MAG: hypothetical protein WC371_02895 [Parachlamydiales bacterium]|jgi:hypothetical protein
MVNPLGACQTGPLETEKKLPKWPVEKPALSLFLGPAQVTGAMWEKAVAGPLPEESAEPFLPDLEKLGQDELDLLFATAILEKDQKLLKEFLKLPKERFLNALKFALSRESGLGSFSERGTQASENLFVYLRSLAKTEGFSEIAGFLPGSASGSAIRC